MTAGQRQAPNNHFHGIALLAGLALHLLCSTALSLAAPLAELEQAKAISHADFDSDGKADPAIYSNGFWQVRLSGAGYALLSTFFGESNALPCVGDYDGDRKDDPAVYEPAAGVWTVLLSGSGYALASVTFTNDALPVVGDYDGDRRADLAVYESSSQSFVARLSAFGYSPVALVFGSSEETPISGDFDGDGLSDPALYAESAGRWRLRLSRSQYAEIVVPDLGGAGLQPVVGDYDGDGQSDPALYGAVAGEWLVKLSRSGYATAEIAGFGGTNYVPVAGDYDNDGSTDIGVYDLSERVMTVRYVGGSDDTQDAITQTNVLRQNRVLFNANKAPDGSIAILYCEQFSQTDWGPLYYQAVDSAGSVLVDEPVILDGEEWEVPLGWSIPLLFDSSGAVHLFLTYTYDEITHLYRAEGSWTNEVLAPANPLNSDFLGRTGPADTFHLLSSGTSDQNLLLFYATNKRGTWEGETLTIPLGATLRFTGKDLAVDSAGNAHIVYGLQDHLGETVTWPGYLYYLSNQSGSWSRELIAYRAHDSWDAAFWYPSLAINAQDQPAVAAHLKYNVLTGSDSLSQLFYARRTGADAWSTEILADTADNYFGTDGGHFTGLYPKLAFDRQERAQIIFSDLASSHVSGYETAEVGQIRFAIGSGGTWTLKTLLAQLAANHEGLTDKYLLLSGESDDLDIVARLYPSYNIVRLTNQRPTEFRF